MATVETVRGPVEAERLGRTLPHEHIFILGQETLANFNHRWDAPWWDEIVESQSDDLPAEPLDSEAPLFILYTSGSTGKPKGVEHSFRTMSAAGKGFSTALGIKKSFE